MTLFISTEYIFKFTSIPSDVDVDLLTPFIITAQIKYIKQCLGENLYNKLITDEIAGGSTGMYLQLVNNYVQISLAHWTEFEALPFIWARITNKSLSLKDSDNSTPATKDVMIYIKGLVRETAEQFTADLERFILKNPTSFPEYFNNAGPHTVKPNQSIYFSGIYTGKSLDNNYCRRPPGYSGGYYS